MGNGISRIYLLELNNNQHARVDAVDATSGAYSTAGRLKSNNGVDRWSARECAAPHRRCSRCWYFYASAFLISVQTPPPSLWVVEADRRWNDRGGSPPRWVIMLSPTTHWMLPARSMDATILHQRIVQLARTAAPPEPE